ASPSRATIVDRDLGSPLGVAAAIGLAREYAASGRWSPPMAGDAHLDPGAVGTDSVSSFGRAPTGVAEAVAGAGIECSRVSRACRMALARAWQRHAVVGPGAEPWQRWPRPPGKFVSGGSPGAE